MESIPGYLLKFFLLYLYVFFLEKVHHAQSTCYHLFNIYKDGIFENMTESAFKSEKTRWSQFCKEIYHDHTKPPTEDMFLDFFKKKKEKGFKYPASMVTKIRVNNWTNDLR
jgi:hypothetical protein